MTKKIYKVGGCIRDNLLNVQSNDIDYVAVGYTPLDFIHLQCVGKDFPVFIDENGCEIALARIEKKSGIGYNGFNAYTNNVTIEDDLKRRDLTINSIAYDEENKTYIDPYGGLNDIQNKVLRHTSDAFKEDPLRVLRLARFQEKFPDFTIADDRQIREIVKQELLKLHKSEQKEVDKNIKKIVRETMVNFAKWQWDKKGVWGSHI